MPKSEARNKQELAIRARHLAIDAIQKWRTSDKALIASRRGSEGEKKEADQDFRVALLKMRIAADALLDICGAPP